MSTYLVTGGTGKTGRRIVENLSLAGHEVRAASRSSLSTPFDWQIPATYAPALDGTDAVFLTVAGQDPRNPELVSEFLMEAAASGVKHAVLLSARAVEFHPQGALAAVEDATRSAAGLSHTILRPSWFSQNFNEGFLIPNANGVVSAPTGDGLEPFIDLDDLAAVASVALTSGGPRGTIALSGSELRSFGEAVELIAARNGRRVRFEAADPEAYRSALTGQLPAEYVDWRMAMFDAIREGRDAYLSSGVQDVLGRDALGLSDWVKTLPDETRELEEANDGE